jgi:hypothetical protein
MNRKGDIRSSRTAVRVRAALASARSRESGQALVIVLIFGLLLILIGPILVTQLSGEDAYTSQGVNFEAALAGAEAGVQQYRNYLDVTFDYWKYNYKNDDGDDALDIATTSPPCGPSDPSSPTCGWKSLIVPSGATPEAFHYVPDPCFLSGNNCGGGSGTATVLLTVTGRAGVPGHYVYRTIQTSLQSNGILTNSYFSQYEVLDPSQNTAIVNVANYAEVTGVQTTANSATVTGKFSGVVAGDTVDLYLHSNFSSSTTVTTVNSSTSLTLSSKATSTTGAGGETMEFGSTVTDTVQNAPGLPVPGTQGLTGFWQALCQYETYIPNAFVDSLTGSNAISDQTGNGGGNFSSSNEYFGPYRGDDPSGSNSSDNFFYYYGFLSDGTPTQTASVTSPCAGPFNFGSGEVFNGPVYTNDQLFTCGNSHSGEPTFDYGLHSGIQPALEATLYPQYTNWPTYISADAGHGGAPTGEGGWIDNADVDWDGSCGDGGNTAPDFVQPATVNGSENLPPVNGALAAAAQKSGGCFFTGPTIIEFIAGTDGPGNSGSFDVWSPLSGVAGAQPVGSGCGTWPSTTVQNVAVSSAGLVIYVDNTPGTVTTQCSTCIASALSTGQSLGALPSGSGVCPDPTKPYASPCPTLPPGDVVVEGEEEGQVTLGAEGNIVISRDLTYQCADDTSGGGQTGVTAQQSTTYTFPTSGSNNCATGETDVLGLVAEGDILISHPGATSASADDQVPYQTEPGEWPDPGNAYCSANQYGVSVTATTSAATAMVDAVPNCVMSQPTIDAALVAITGAFGDEDWDMGQNTNGQQAAYLQGTDISDYR